MKASLIIRLKFGGFLEAGEDASAFFEPADEPFDDVAAAVRFFVERVGAGVAIFILLRRNHRFHAQFGQVLVDPISPVEALSLKRLIPQILNGKACQKWCDGTRDFHDAPRSKCCTKSSRESENFQTSGQF